MGHRSLGAAAIAVVAPAARAVGTEVVGRPLETRDLDAQLIGLSSHGEVADGVEEGAAHGGGGGRWFLHPVQEGAQMATKKRSASAQKALKATVKELRSKLDRANDRAERWKIKAARFKEARTELEAQVKELKKRNKRLEKALRQAAPRTPTATEDPPMVAEGPESALPRPSAAPSPTVTPSTVEPDASWTVAQLRAEARLRGLTGLSGKTKAQLLAALS